LSSKRKKAAKQLAVKIQEILPAQLLQPL